MATGVGATRIVRLTQSNWDHFRGDCEGALMMLGIGLDPITKPVAAAADGTGGTNTVSPEHDMKARGLIQQGAG